MDIYIVSIGNEILEGSILDTNSNYIAKRLTLEGYKVEGFFAISDNLENLAELFRQLSEKEAIIITTGGLGPTFDDNTTSALSIACNKELKLNKQAYFDVLKKVRAKGVRLKLSHTKQAYLPKDCNIIPNRYGTACGIYLKCNKAHFLCLPGVPTEMKPMFENHCIDMIKEIAPQKNMHRVDIKLIGIAESDMDKFLSNFNKDDVEIILNAMEGELAVRIVSETKEKVEFFVNQIQDEFGYKVYSTKNEPIEDVLAELLDDLNLQIGFLESITAGYLAELMYDKQCFAYSIVGKNTDIQKAPKVNIVACPCNLVGNEFDLKLKIQDKMINTTLRYLGNVNFMRKSISKRTLGFIYQWLNERDSLNF